MRAIGSKSITHPNGGKSHMTPFAFSPTSARSANRSCYAKCGSLSCGANAGP